MIPDPSGAADAVILVDDSGAVTLFIGDNPEPYAEAATNARVIRILMDYAARADRRITVATRYPSGHRTLHRVEPDGSVSVRMAIPDRAAASTTVPVTTSAAAPAATDIRLAVGTEEPARGSALRPSAVVGTAAVLAMVLTLTSSGGPPLTTADAVARYAMGLNGGVGDHGLRGPLQDPATDSWTAPPTTPGPDPTESPEPLESPSESPSGSPAQPDDTSTDEPSGDTLDTETPEPTDRPRTDEPPAPPSRPGNLGVAERTGSSVTVSWQVAAADLDVTGYAVHVDGSRMDTVPDTSTTVGGLRSGASYVISVAAIDSGGNVGSAASITATTLDTEPPTTPSDLAVTGREGDALTLAWRPSSDNVGVTSYAVYVDGRRSRTVSGTTATVGDLTPATTYQISVAAMDAAGNVSGKASTQGTTVDTIPPTRPGDLNGRSSITTVELDWSSSSDNVGVIGYAVYIDGRRAATTSSTTATINNLDGATAYTFSVAAFDAAGNYGERASIEVWTMAER